MALLGENQGALGVESREPKAGAVISTDNADWISDKAPGARPNCRVSSWYQDTGVGAHATRPTSNRTISARAVLEEAEPASDIDLRLQAI
jgi:hypothetical protein